MIDDIKLNVFSTALIEFLRDRFSLSGTSNQLLSIVVLNSILWINHTIDITHVKYALSVVLQPKYIVCAIALFGIIAYTRMHINHPKLKSTTDNTNVTVAKSTDKYIIIDVSNIPKYIMAIYKYINLNPHMFNTNVDTKYIIYVEDSMLPLYNDKMHFNDREHGVMGYITTNYTYSIVDKNKQHNYEMYIHIDRQSPAVVDNTQCVDYITMIMKYLENDAKYGSQVQLYYYKILNSKLIKTKYYDADVNNWKRDVKLLQDTFFGDNKDLIFNITNHKMRGTNIVESQAWNNLLLHSKQGGLGKSSVIQRIATMLKKNVLSIDIAQYINKKNDLFAIFHNQPFRLPCGDNTEYSVDNYIIVLEEFDHAIAQLSNIDVFIQMKNNLIQENIKHEQTAIQANTDVIMQSPIGHNQDIYTQGNQNSTFLTMSNSANQTMDDIIQNEIRNTKSVSGRISNNISAINNEILRITNANIDPTQQNLLYLGDLLELFQGPIHITDRIIIATTNNFEVIEKALPMLVRPGRLTPLKFTYLDWDMFCRLVQYYLHDMPDIEEFKITIPTSQIIELIIKHKNTKTADASKFVGHIKSLCAIHERI